MLAKWLAALTAFLLAFPSRTIACDLYYTQPTTLSTRGGLWTAQVNLYDRQHYFDGSMFRLCDIYVFTRNKRFADFIYDKGITDAFWKAIRAELWYHSCADLLDGKRLLRLERNIARAVRKFYRKQTRRRAGRFNLMVDVQVPHYPYCLR